MGDKRKPGRHGTARLVRDLQIVGRCSRALVRARSEREALQSVCDALVQTAAADLAWVGYGEDDAAKTVRPAAGAGRNAAWLKRARHSWDPARGGREPAGAAIRSGRRCRVKDIRASRVFRDRHADVLAHGYRSCVAFPLLAGGADGRRFDLRGALVLYARAPDAFDDGRVGILADIAANLACTIARLRGSVAGDARHGERTRPSPRRRAEAPADSEDQLRLAIDTIPAAAWIALPDGSNAFVNRWWSDYSGLHGEDTLGRGWKAALHPDDIEGHVEKWHASLATGQPFESEARLRRAADGDYRWFLIRAAPLRDASGHVVRWCGIATDIEDRRQAEQALRRSEAYLAEAQRMSHTGSWAADLASQRVIHSSEEHHRLFGFDPAAGMPAWEDWVLRIHPDDRQKTMEIIARNTREGVDFEFDCRIVRPDGGIRYVHTVAHPVLGPSGVPVECMGTTIDVTERRQAETALRDSEERWRAAFENNPTMYFMVDPDAVVLSVNPFGAEHLGFSAGELTGASFLEIFHESDRAAARRNIERCLARVGRSMSIELRMMRKDGATLWVRETARAVPMKDRPVVLVACEDVTDRKRAETLAAQVFESAPDGICIVGRDYRYRRSNPVYARRWGRTAEQIVGMHVADILGAEAFDGVLKSRLDRCFAGEEVLFAWSIETRGRLYLSVSYSPLRSGSGEVDAALVIQRDMTEYTRASDALREAQAGLAHVNRLATMGQLTASIAHEVNQPIAATVIGAEAALRWLDRRPPDLQELRNALTQIVDDGVRAGQVVGRIRDLFRKAPPRKDLLEINEPIREVIAITRGEATKSRVLVKTALADGLPAVRGDRVQLQQVVLNLIINAVEAMAGVDGARELLIDTGRDASGGVRVSVRDSGPGLAPSAHERIFDAFYTTKPAGLGMGLSICRSIIEAHGGRLWAGANEPRGAVFQFTVPAEEDTAPSGQPHEGRRPAS